MWFSQIKSENLKLYLRGVRIIEEKAAKRGRFAALCLLAYGAAVETTRLFWQEEWEREFWTPDWVLSSRREHYVNEVYMKLKDKQQTTFEITNWDKESKMVYHVDTLGNHRYEKLILPAYHYGSLESTTSIEKFYKLSVYNMNKNKRNDLDNYLRHKTLTLGDWLIALYYHFNVLTQSFDPFFYKPSYFSQLDQESLYLNLQTSDKPSTILRLLNYSSQVLLYLESLFH